MAAVNRPCTCYAFVVSYMVKEVVLKQQES